MTKLFLLLLLCPIKTKNSYSHDVIRKIGLRYLYLWARHANSFYINMLYDKEKPVRPIPNPGVDIHINESENPPRPKFKG